MPVYVFRDKDSDETVEHFMSLAKYDALKWVDGEVVIDGARLARDLATEKRGFRHAAGNWPIYSDAFGCHPDQVQESMQEATKRGVPTEYTRDGRAVFRDRAHRKKVLSAFGFRDNDAGYGD